MANSTDLYIKFIGELSNLRKAQADAKKLIEEFKSQQGKITKREASVARSTAKKAMLDEQKEYKKNQDYKRKLNINSVKMQQRDEERQVKERHKLETRLFKERKNQGSQTIKDQQRDEERASKKRQQLIQNEVNAAKRILGGAVNLGGRVLGGVTNMFMGAAQQGYARYNDVMGAGRAPLVGLAGGRTTMRNINKRMGSRLGFNVSESQALIPTMGRATGTTGPREMEQGMRATGLDSGELSSFYQTIRGGGSRFGDLSGAGVSKGQSSGGQEFQKWIALGMKSGIEKARLPQFFEGIQGIMEEQLKVSSGDVKGTGIGKILAAMGASGFSGFQGARGAAIAGKLNAGIMNPGGGEAGKAFMLQAMGFGNPGSRVSFGSAERKMERGLNGDNLMSVMGETRKQFGQGDEASHVLKEIFGVSLDQADKLQQIFDSDKSDLEKSKEMQKVADESKSLEKQSLEAMTGISGEMKYLSKIYDESVKQGATAAPLIKAIEKWERELVTKYMPDVVKYGMAGFEVLKEAVSWLYDLVSGLGNWITGENKTSINEKQAGFEAQHKALDTNDPALYRGYRREEAEHFNAAAAAYDQDNEFTKAGINKRRAQHALDADSYIQAKQRMKLGLEQNGIKADPLSATDFSAANGISSTPSVYGSRNDPTLRKKAITALASEKTPDEMSRSNDKFNEQMKVEKARRKREGDFSYDKTPDVSVVPTVNGTSIEIKVYNDGTPLKDVTKQTP